MIDERPTEKRGWSPLPFSLSAPSEESTVDMSRVLHGEEVDRARAFFRIILAIALLTAGFIPFLTGADLADLRLGGRGKQDSHTISVAGRCGTVEVICEVGGKRDHIVFELELSFSGGRIRVGNGIYEEWVSLESTYYEQMRSLYRSDIPEIGETGYFSGMMEDAVRLTGDAQGRAISSFSDGLKSLEIVEKVKRLLR